MALCCDVGDAHAVHRAESCVVSSRASCRVVRTCVRRSLVAATSRVVDRHLLPTQPITRHFSAVCWLTARNLADLLGPDVPIGAIDQSYGGTSIQFWMGTAALAASDAPQASQCCGQDGGASCLYNTQVYPYTLGPMPVSYTHLTLPTIYSV